MSYLNFLNACLKMLEIINTNKEHKKQVQNIKMDKYMNLKYCLNEFDYIYYDYYN